MLSQTKLGKLPRVQLANLPTPVQELCNLTQMLGGPRLLIKRDDLTGLATGGNKTRKLEFLMAEALELEADCVITAGGPQSNHCRQTAAAAAQLGLKSHLVLGGEPQRAAGNLLLDELLGAQLHWTAKTNRNTRMKELAEQLRSDGCKPYIIPVGGSNARGAIGYVAAMAELIQQLDDEGYQVDHMVFPTSSGGTQAGMVLGAALCGFQGKVTAISIDQIPDEQVPADQSSEKFLTGICHVANQAAKLLGAEQQLSVKDFDTNYDYLGAGYGVVGNLERDAIKLLARSEGILTGPVYSGRAMGGLVDMIRRGVYTLDETVLFWHTGDESALHAYLDDLL